MRHIFGCLGVPCMSTVICGSIGIGQSILQRPWIFIFLYAGKIEVETAWKPLQGGGHLLQPSSTPKFRVSVLHGKSHKAPVRTHLRLDGNRYMQSNFARHRVPRYLKYDWVACSFLRRLVCPFSIPAVILSGWNMACGSGILRLFSS